MAKAKNPKPVTDPEAPEAPAAQTPADKLYLHVCSQAGYSMPMAVVFPLTEVGKKTISDAIDNGDRAEIIDEAQFNALRTDCNLSLPCPTDEKHAEVCKIIDYEPLIKKEISCTEYFDHQFTPDEIKQMAMEFAEATATKSDLEADLKSHKKATEARISEEEATIKRISTDLARGKRSESVKCHWVLNDPKRGQKSFYRLDTDPKQLIKIGVMSASDKQLTLEDIAAAKRQTERTVEEKEVTKVANQPYDGEMLTDKEVEDETGVTPEPESESESEAEADDSCPI